MEKAQEFTIVDFVRGIFELRNFRIQSPVTKSGGRVLWWRLPPLLFSSHCPFDLSLLSLFFTFVNMVEWESQTEIIHDGGGFLDIDRSRYVLKLAPPRSEAFGKFMHVLLGLYMYAFSSHHMIHDVNWTVAGSLSHRWTLIGLSFRARRPFGGLWCVYPFERLVHALINPKDFLLRWSIFPSFCSRRDVRDTQTLDDVAI